MIQFEKKYGVSKSERLAYFNLGITLAEAKKYDLAIDALKNSLKSKGNIPTDSEIFYSCGDSYGNLGDSINSIKFYCQGISASNKGKTRALHKIYDLVGDDSMTVKRIMEIEEIGLDGLFKKLTDKTEIDALNILLAKLHLMIANHEKAMKYLVAVSFGSHILDFFKKRVNIFISNEEKRNRKNWFECLGLAYYNEKKFEESEKSYLMSLSYTNKSEVSYSTISFAYIKTMISAGRFDKAVSKLSELNENIPIKGNSNLSELTRIAGYFMQLREPDKAFSIVERFKGQKLNETSWRVKIECELALHKYDDAVESIGVAVTEYPFNDELFFLKIEVYIESQYAILEGMKIFNEIYFSESKRDNVKEKLNQIIGLRLDDNAIYFVCFIYFLMGEKYNPGDKQTEQLKLDTISDQKNYSVIGNYVLEALLIENDDKKIASAKFFEAGWRYYWLNKLSDATYFLQRAHELVDRREIENDLADKKELDINYSLWFYYADALRMTSRTNQPPYIDNNLIQKASEIILETGCGKKLVHDSRDSWFYLVAARIHCDRFLFAGENMLDEYWQAIVYTEWALLYKKKDYMAYTDLGKYYASIRLYNVALENFKIALEINKQEAEEYPFFLEHYAICLMELRMLADAGVIINKLKKLPGTGDKEYLHWEGYVEYLNDNYEEAIKKIDEYINNNGEDVWTLYTKMMSLLFNPTGQNIEGARTIASKIVSIEPEKYPDRVFEFAWADLVLGNIDIAIERLEGNCKRASIKNYESRTLCQLYLLKGDDLKTEENFKFYIQNEFSVHDVKTFEKEIRVIAKLFERENQVIEKLNLWKELIVGKIHELEKENVNAEWEFESFLKEFDLKVESPVDKLSLPLIAHHLRLARKKWDEGYKERAKELYSDLQKEFPQAEFAIQVISQQIILDELSHQNFENYIEELNHCLEEGKYGENVWDDLQVKLQSALEKATDDKDSEIFDKTIALLYLKGKFDLIIELTKKYKNSGDIKMIKHVTWGNIAFANLDFFEREINDSSGEQGAIIYKENVLVACDEVLKNTKDHGEAIMTKIFLFTVDLLVLNRSNSKDEIKRQFNILLDKDSSPWGCYEAIRLFENNKNGTYLSDYLQKLEAKFPNEFEKVRKKAKQAESSTQVAEVLNN